MKPILIVAAIALFAGEARADWKDLKPGMDYHAATACAGVPLIQNRGKGGCETWTYDCRGYIQFRYGRVTYWDAPKTPVAQVSGRSGPAQPTPATNPAGVARGHPRATVVAKN